VFVTHTNSCISSCDAACCLPNSVIHSQIWKMF